MELAHHVVVVIVVVFVVVAVFVVVDVVVALGHLLNMIAITARCFNCGDVSRHLASACPHPPLPKRCHHCKVAHLLRDDD